MAGMGWGGVIASALAGGTAGAMSSVAKDIDDQQKAALQAQRDERLAQLTRQNQEALARLNSQLEIDSIGPKAKANTQAIVDNLPAAIDAENRRVAGTAEAKAAAAQGEAKARAAGEMEGKGGQVLSKGSVLLDKDGNIKFDNSDTQTQEDKDLKKAQARKEDAVAGYYKSEAERKVAKDESGGGKAEKPVAEYKASYKKVDGAKIPGAPAGAEVQWDEGTQTFRVFVNPKDAKEAVKEPAWKVWASDQKAEPAVAGGWKYLDADMKPITVSELAARGRAAQGRSVETGKPEPAPSGSVAAAGKAAVSPPTAQPGTAKEGIPIPAGLEPPPNGTIVRDPKDGKQYMIRNGRMFPQ